MTFMNAIFLTGFLEILLSSAIGFKMFEVSPMTSVDIVTVVLNVIYATLTVFFCFIVIWFVAIRSRRLVQMKQRRD